MTISMKLRSLPNLRLFLLCAATWLLVACATPNRPAPPTGELAWEPGTAFVVDDLLIQARKLPQFTRVKALLDKVINAVDGSGVGRPVIVLDSVVDGISGQQTASTRALDARLLQHATSEFDQFDIVPVAVDQLQRAKFLATGTLTVVGRAGGFTSYRVHLSLTELSSGLVVAQSTVRIKAKGVDSTPSRFFRDSPSLTKDRVIEGQIRTAQTLTGAAADKVYLARLPVSALISDAARLYESGDYIEAIRYYEAAVARPDERQMRALVGIYLSNVQLGRHEAAASTFGRVVALGLATNNLAVKFLFRPGSTDFVADPKVSGPYAVWLTQLAQELVVARSCLVIVGHTSRTGSEALNDRLSLQRAAAIQKRLEDIAPETAGRFELLGMGFRENLIGSGTDDQQDALDRRVEFKVRACG